MEPRAYQQAIFETAKKHNTLVVLPTGLGKSVIALMLIDHRLKQFPKTKALVLAPTRPLVAQWLDYFKKHSENKDKEIHLFTGKINSSKRKEIWKIANIVLSTPQCISNDLKNGLINLADTSVMVEDECHRCLKNYSYTHVAREYLKQAKNSRILGLTASPASNPKIIKEICENLGIDAIEIRTRDSDDVKPYLQKLKTEIVKLELPEEIKKIRALLLELCKKKIEELKNRKLLFGPATKKNLLELQAKLHKMIASGNHHFNILRGVSVCAQAIKLQYVLELLETQTLGSCIAYMNEIFEQVRQNKSKAVKQLSKELNEIYLKLIKLQKDNIENPKLEKLKEIVLRESKAKPDFRIIIFSQYRSTIAQINEMLLKQDIKSSPFIGQAMRKQLDGMTQKEQQLILYRFREGKINCLVASSVGEEGLDISEVNLVIFYEPIPSAIRSIQRRGRTARLKPGKVIIIMVKDTRDESNYWASFRKEKKMYGVLEDLKNSMQNNLKKQQIKKQQKKISEFN